MRLAEAARDLDGVIDRLWAARQDMGAVDLDSATVRLCEALADHFVALPQGSADAVADLVGVTSDEMREWTEGLGRIRRELFTELWDKYRASHTRSDV